MAAYMGSKRRVAKKILPIILKDRTPNQLYCEPFLGGANTMIHVDGRRLGSDAHPYLMAMWKALQKGWIPPTECSREFWYKVKKNKEDYEPCLVGFVGFGCSFGRIYFGAYHNDDIRNKDHIITGADRASRTFKKDMDLMKDVIFEQGSYEQLDIEENSIIYCDPPYKGTKKYEGTDEFNHEKFWDWVRRKSQNNSVYISEFEAPKDFDCLIEIQCTSNISSVKSVKITERLFKYKYGI